MPKTPENGGGQKLQSVSLDQQSIEKLANKLYTKQQRPRKTKNEWRSLLAVILVVGFLIIISFVVVADQVWGAKTNAKDLLGSVGTLIASPLSFVIGYYYKGKD